jgi:hypothetical protein
VCILLVFVFNVIVLYGLLLLDWIMKITSHSRNEDYCLLGRDAMQSGR